MKRIEAFLQPHRLGEVIEVLHAQPRFPGFTVLQSRGQGHGRGPHGQYTYDEGDLSLHNRRVLIMFCEDSEVARFTQLIARVAHTGNPGDGIVVVSEVAEILRIRDAGPVQGGAA